MIALNCQIFAKKKYKKSSSQGLFSISNIFSRAKLINQQCHNLFPLNKDENQAWSLTQAIKFKIILVQILIFRCTGKYGDGLHCIYSTDSNVCNG